MKYPLPCIKRGLCNCFCVGSKSARPEDWSLASLPLRPAQGECGVCHPQRGFADRPSGQSQQHWVRLCRCLPQFPCGQQQGQETSSASPRGLWTKFALPVQWPVAAVSGSPWALLSGFLVSQGKTGKHEARPLLSCWLSLFTERKAARPKRREERCLDSDLEQTVPREGFGGQGHVVVSFLGKLWDKLYMDVYVSWHSSL